MCQHPFVSKHFLLEYVEKVTFELMEFADSEQKQVALNWLLRTIRQYIHSQEVNSLQLENIETERKMWFLPSFTVDLINASSDIEEQMLYIMNRLKAMGIKSTYVYFYGDGALCSSCRMTKPDFTLRMFFSQEKNSMESCFVKQSRKSFRLC